jgi:alpha-mannosidase
MQKHLDLTRHRTQKFAAQLLDLFYSHALPVQLQAFAAPGRISYKEAMHGVYQPVHIGDRFEPLWSTHWVKISCELPSAWHGQEVHLLWDSNSEACVWHDGMPLQGLTGSHNGWQVDAIRKEFCLTRSCQGGEFIEVFVEVACNGLFGVENQAHNLRIGELSQAEIAIFNRSAWDLYWDLKVIADMALHLPANTPRGGQALYAANQMVNTILLDDPATWTAARAIAARFFAARNGDGQHNLSAIGHAHIDTAWLWPIAETKRKSIRTFSSALRDMEAYPGYQFACPQAQQLAWIKTSQPGLYNRIQEKAQAGQFIPVGGTWVEPDCNLPSGESLVRQFLYGQRFFEAEFGARCQEFWNPDVFGYSGALPQIMKLSGIRYFLTQKLSWNQFNKPTSHTFIWEGIDGSRVLTHFPPADTYNSIATVKEVLYNVSNFKDHERANESYLLFGYGDGGGGPTPAMLEQLHRMVDVDGLPRIQIRSPREFFARCEDDLKDPLVISGELYFELHRGTYTSQARNKRSNRQSELLLRDAEMLVALAFAQGKLDYPSALLETLWKSVLTNQFHDIIPGSSIGLVYEDSARDYQFVFEQATNLRQDALHSLIPSIPADVPEKVFVFNTLGISRTEVVELAAGLAGAQTLADGGSLGVVQAPPLGYAVQSPACTIDSASVRETITGFELENPYLLARFNHTGGLVSLFHKTTHRESIQPGALGNHFVLYEDLPNSWDAWDVDVFHLEKQLPLKSASRFEIIEKGPLRVALAFYYDISSISKMRQVISLDALSSRLEFHCEVDWHERHKFLKVEFPINVQAQFATYEIQFGHVQRPTHYNTSFDLARFEVPAHKWADLSETDFGVALLNDCKYGYSAHGNILRLSLLRAPTHPDPEADQGMHQFRFALFPHQGSPQLAGVTDEAYRFNVPLLVGNASGSDFKRSFFLLDHPALVLDTIKKAEDSNAIIVRLYEPRGARGTVQMTGSLPVQTASRTNLLEDELMELNWTETGVQIDFNPFEIITLRLSLAAGDTGSHGPQPQTAPDERS